MSKNLTMVLALILVFVAGMVVYERLHDPRPAEDVLNDAMGELKQGNINEAFDEMGNTTPLDKAKDDMNDALGNP